MVETPEEIQAIIDMAHWSGADSIEQGPLDDAAIALMKKRGTAYTPTLLAGKPIGRTRQSFLRHEGR